MFLWPHRWEQRPFLGYSSNFATPRDALHSCANFGGLPGHVWGRGVPDEKTSVVKRLYVPKSASIFCLDICKLYIHTYTHIYTHIYIYHTISNCQSRILKPTAAPLLKQHVNTHDQMGYVIADSHYQIWWPWHCWLSKPSNLVPKLTGGTDQEWLWQIPFIFIQPIESSNQWPSTDIYTCAPKMQIGIQKIPIGAHDVLPLNRAGSPWTCLLKCPCNQFHLIQSGMTCMILS